MIVNGEKTKKADVVLIINYLGKTEGAHAIFLIVCSLDFELFYVILYMHINLLFAHALFRLWRRYGAGFGGKHEII